MPFLELGSLDPRADLTATMQRIHAYYSRGEKFYPYDIYSMGGPNHRIKARTTGLWRSANCLSKGNNGSWRVKENIYDHIPSDRPHVCDNCPLNPDIERSNKGRKQEYFCFIPRSLNRDP